MSGVHIIALLSALGTLTVIVEMTRRRQLPEKYALLWLTVGIAIGALAVAPGLFNRLARSVGVVEPPALLAVVASLFLLVLCVYFSWEIGRAEDKIRVLAIEVTLLRKDVDDLAPAWSHAGQGGLVAEPKNSPPELTPPPIAPDNPGSNIRPVHP